MNLSNVTSPAVGAAGFLAASMVATKIPTGAAPNAPPTTFQAAVPSLALAVGGHFLRRMDGPALKNFGGGFQMAGAVGLLGLAMAFLRNR